MFLQNLRAKVGARLNGDSEAGFTLIELLVVMLILGILAAIAIPAFFNQREKAKDASAKSMARTAETAMETYATDHGGSYSEGTPAPADLNEIEETINATTSTEKPYLSAVATPAADEFTVTVTSPETDNEFEITRNSSGVVEFNCHQEGGTETGQGGCPSGGNWAK
jgi:type IV pilus assembly protein PilA